MKLHVVYRTNGGENAKPRPESYSKAAALRSFCTALELVPAVGDVVFVVDGPMAADELDVVRGLGEVVRLPGVGNASSYRHVLRVVLERDWSKDDLVYIAEDDYLYLPEALTHVVAAATKIDRAAFFTPYDHPDYYEHSSAVRFARRHRKECWDVEGIEWRAVRSTTMTFAARIGALRQAAFMHILGSRGRYPHDFDIWSATQTRLYRARIVRSLAYRRNATPVAGPRLSPLDRGRSLVADPRCALLVAPCAPLAAHMEIGLMPRGVDWSGLAEEFATASLR
jgi:hypothetical protein